jgi:DNA-binding XRE family transcriptional regulator
MEPRNDILSPKVRDEIAAKVGVSSKYVYMILDDRRKPSWKMAVSLAKVTKTKPVIWMQESGEVISQEIAKKLKLQN